MSDHTIDFDATVLSIVERADPAFIRQQLVRVWNARGAADITQAETELVETMGASSCAPYVKKITRGLRALDR